MFACLVLSCLHVTVGPPACGPEALSDRVCTSLYNLYNTGTKIVYYRTECMKPAHKAFLNYCAQFYTHLLLDGRCITPLAESRSQNASVAVVKVVLNDRMHVGEVL